MTDYDPRMDRPADKPVHSDTAFVPRSPSRSLYLVAGVIAAIVMVAGLMFFANDTSDRNDVARTPDAMTAPQINETRTPTIPREAPAPAAPAPTRPQE